MESGIPLANRLDGKEAWSFANAKVPKSAHIVGEKRWLHGLGSWRGRRKPQEYVRSRTRAKVAAGATERVCGECPTPVLIRIENQDSISH
jgi:hypothetical protein